ncbi:glycosyltransferase [Aeromonas sp. MR16]|uniref:glycosyltransferase family 2 protein n=1 Tax=Aeromonas sp. MR16 TaxID=2923420 RepID=UPI001F4AE1A5|nr:glycosyltransferase [Aeromonas sp. MR16]MCH7371158.1 glycosyltransferase [Aeromonas sp. MR16]
MEQKVLNLCVVVVIYNKSFFNSKTLQSLLYQKYVKDYLYITLNIYDNSVDAKIKTNDIIALNENFSKVNYNHDGFNHPLSVIYEREFKKDGGDYVLLLDDDTTLPGNYFEAFFLQYKKYGDGVVFVPRITINGKLFSPYHSWLFISKPINSNHQGQSHGISAINSGVYIPKTKKIESFKYPEYTTFYGTDTVLFEYINRENICIVTMGISVSHDLTFHPSSEIDKYMLSLSKVVCFWKAHYKKNIFSYIMLFFYLLFLTVKLSLKTRKFINLFNM